MPLKILILKSEDPERYSLLTHLMDHKSERTYFVEYWKYVKEIIVDFIMGLEGLSPDLTEEDIFRVVGVVDTNAHEISCQSGTDIKGVFPLVSLLNHRCIINTRYIMIKQKPFKNTCRATVIIPKGQEIFTSYLWPHQTTRVRRNNLQDGWHFSCNCTRCSDPAEMGALTSAILCVACDGGYMLHENPLTKEDDEAVWKCQQCYKFGDATKIRTLLEDLSTEVDSLSRGDVEGSSACLQKCRKSLHCNHHLLTELRSRMIPIICRSGSSSLDDFSVSVIETKRRLCKENMAVLNIITPGLSTKRGGLLFEWQECEFFLAKRQLEDGKLSEKAFLVVLELCKRLLTECQQCLTRERPKSIEYFYEQSAKHSLKAVNEYIITFSS
jgi:hypothetical protein